MKKAADVKVGKKRNGKFTVSKRGGGLVNGPDKVKILQEKGLLKKLTAKKKDEPAPAT